MQSNYMVNFEKFLHIIPISRLVKSLSFQKFKLKKIYDFMSKKWNRDGILKPKLSFVMKNPKDDN